MSLLVGCALLVSGCAIDRDVTPNGRERIRGRVGTNTAVSITAEGRAAEIVAANLGVPQPPPDWNDDTRKARRQHLAATSGVPSYLQVTVGENQTKGLGIVGTAIVGYATAGALEAASLAKTAADKATAISAGKQATRRALDANATKVSLAEIDAAAKAAPAVVAPVVPVP